MSDTTIIAAIILGGVFLIMLVTIIKSGVEGAIKMWNLMGALTGVAFGAITSFYFTNQVNQQEIAGLQTAYIEASDTALKAQQSIASIEAVLKKPAPARPAFTDKHRTQLIRQLDTTNKELQQIQLYRKSLPKVPANKP